MKWSAKKYFILGHVALTCFSFFSCGNPKILYHVARVNLFQDIKTYSDGDQLPPQTTLLSEEFSAHKDNWIFIYNSADLAISFEMLDTEKNSDYLEAIGFPLSSIVRLPKSYYFRYNLVYRGKQSLKINFYKSYFQDEFKHRYEPISKKEFEKTYTSFFYSWINYNKLHRIYAQNIDPSNKKKKIYQALNRQPEKSVEITPKSNIFQIVSYPFFSLRSKRYNLLLRFKIGNVTKEINTPLYYLSTRDDLPER